jgi:hypothetical protein
MALGGGIPRGEDDVVRRETRQRGMEAMLLEALGSWKMQGLGPRASSLIRKKIMSRSDGH